MNNKVCIKSLTSKKGLYDSNGDVEIRFTVGSSNDRTTLEQDLILINEGAGWTADMNMEGFPPQKDTNAAAMKLADWMERMATAIKSGEYNQIDLNNL